MGSRTPNLLNAIEVLYQLSYGPDYSLFFWSRVSCARESHRVQASNPETTAGGSYKKAKLEIPLFSSKKSIPIMG